MTDGPYRESQKPEDTFRFVFVVHFKSGAHFQYERSGIKRSEARVFEQRELDDLGQGGGTHRSRYAINIHTGMEEKTHTEHVVLDRIERVSVTKINERMSSERLAAEQVARTERMNKRSYE